MTTRNHKIAIVIDRIFRRQSTQVITRYVLSICFVKAFHFSLVAPLYVLVDFRPECVGANFFANHLFLFIETS